MKRLVTLIFILAVAFNLASCGKLADEAEKLETTIEKGTSYLGPSGLKLDEKLDEAEQLEMGTVEEPSGLNLNDQMLIILDD